MITGTDGGTMENNNRCIMVNRVYQSTGDQATTDLVNVGLTVLGIWFLIRIQFKAMQKNY